MGIMKSNSLYFEVEGRGNCDGLKILVGKKVFLF